MPKIRHLALLTDDQEALAKFYIDVFEMKEVHRHPSLLQGPRNLLIRRVSQPRDLTAAGRPPGVFSFRHSSRRRREIGRSGACGRRDAADTKSCRRTAASPNASSSIPPARASISARSGSTEPNCGRRWTTRTSRGFSNAHGAHATTIDAVRVGLSLDPGNAMLYVYRACAYDEIGRSDEAIADCEQRCGSNRRAVPRSSH